MRVEKVEFCFRLSTRKMASLRHKVDKVDKVDLFHKLYKSYTHTQEPSVPKYERNKTPNIGKFLNFLNYFRKNGVTTRIVTVEFLNSFVNFLNYLVEFPQLSSTISSTRRKEKRNMGIFSRFFNREPPKTHAAVINIPNAGFSTFTGSAYETDVYRAAVDAIARNAGKLKGVHTYVSAGERKPANDKKLCRLLQVSPNEYMSAYDLIYKLTTQYFTNNNAFAVLDWNERGQLAGIYPVNYTHVDLQVDAADTLYVAFTFRNGKKAQFLYSDVIHLRRHFNGNEFLGDDNRALDAALELAHTQNQGLVNSIKSSANLRGILKFTQLLSKPKLQELKNYFVKEYLSISNSGGVVATDNQMEYQPIESKPVNLDSNQLQLVQEKIYGYLGVSKAIVTSSYTEDEFSAFYESVIEPLATQMSLEFTRKIFNEREQAFGNQIVFESGRLQFSSNATKINLIKELMPLGLLTVNQALEVLNLAPVEGGDRRLQTLNVVDASRVTEYQLMKAGISNERNSDSSNQFVGGNET